MRRYIVTALLALVASLTMTAPASAATSVLTGQFGADCASIDIDSSGWDPTYQVEVIYYGDAATPTPGVDGTAFAPVNAPWSMPVDPQKVRGFSFRIVDAGGEFVTPLKDEAASCNIVLTPYITTESTCDSVTVHTRNYSDQVIEVSYNGEVLSSITKPIGPQDVTVALDGKGGSWSVRVWYAQFPSYEGGYRYADGTVDACPVTPPVVTPPVVTPPVAAPTSVPDLAPAPAPIAAPMLAETGAGSAPLTWIGLVSLCLGVLALVGTRRQVLPAQSTPSARLGDQRR